MEIRKFFYELFGEIKTVILDGEPWFLATDICKILGYKNPSEATLDHTSKNDRKALGYKAYSKTLLAELWGKNDFMDKVLVNESGLYCLIFSSKKPEAIEFRNWVTQTVLPSIRVNGGYIEGQENLSPEEREEILSQVRRVSSEVKRLQRKRNRLFAKIKETENLNKRRRLAKSLRDTEYLYNRLCFEYQNVCNELLEDRPPCVVKQTPSVIKQEGIIIIS